MFSRLNDEAIGTPLPPAWSEEHKKILLKIYGDKCLAHDKTFGVYGFTFSNEFLLIVSYLDLKGSLTHNAPITLLLSIDLKPETKTEKLIPELFDIVGVFFDQLFAKDTEQLNANEEIYSPLWTEEEINGHQVFVQVTRENIELFLTAELLLKKV